jgi:flagellar motor switch protein FliG
MMHEDEIKEVSGAMSQLGSVKAELVEQVCVSFSESLGAAGALVGSFESTERLLQKTLPKERVSQIMEELRGPAGRTMWDKLGNVHEAVLANYLKNEYPQTVAVVISKLKADHAARVLSVLPDSFAMEVVMRMLRMESVQRDVLDGVERTLRSEFMSNLARSTRRDAHEMMAEIFNNLDRAAEARFVSALEERNREAAERIKALMFTFDDLARLTSQSMQVLLRSVDKEKLPLALKGASEKLRDLFYRNLSERAGKMLRDDIEALGPVKLRDVDEAQASIVLTAKELGASGDIDIGAGKDEELVYGREGRCSFLKKRTKKLLLLLARRCLRLRGQSRKSLLLLFFRKEDSSFPWRPHGRPSFGPRLRGRHPVHRGFRRAA